MLLLYALDVCRMLLLLVTQTHKCSGDRAINAPLGAAHLVAELRQLFLLAGEPAKVEVGHLHATPSTPSAPARWEETYMSGC